MTAIRFHVVNISRILRGLSLSRGLIFGVLSVYYVLTVLTALMEGVGMVLVVNIFTGGMSGSDHLVLPGYIGKLTHSVIGDVKLPSLITFLILLSSINLIVRFSLLVFEGGMGAFLRQRLQETIFRRYLLGDWAHMRNFRVGESVGTNTQEAMVVSKYLTSVVSGLYFMLSAIAMAGLALITSYEMSLILALTALPIIWLMLKAFSDQARLSKRSAVLRNEFSAAITDRFNGLLQVHVDNNYDFHLRQGLQTQNQLRWLEVLIAVSGAVIGSFNLLLTLILLIGLSIWFFIMGSDSLPNLVLVASVGVLGMRVASQLNGAVAQVANVSRLSGSLYPVLDALSVPSLPERKPITERIVHVQLENVSYSYDHHKVVNGVTLMAKKGVPLVLSGPSGNGKTTLANMIAGLYFPSSGAVSYIGTSGRAYHSGHHRAKVGFVTQDIYLFQGSLRSNLAAGRNCSDGQIWDALEQVNAVGFVRAMGGLDTESAEAGRSLSGGQRRRLGIARVLLSGSDILIFDEVTAGLDQPNKAAVLNVIRLLSEDYVIVVISHDEISFGAQKRYSVT